MGLGKEAHGRDGKRLLQKDLRSLFWDNHVDVVDTNSQHPDGTPDTSHHSDGSDSSDTSHHFTDTSDSDHNTTHHSSDDETLSEMYLRLCKEKNSENGGEEGEWNFGFEIGDKVEVHWPEEGDWFVVDITDVNE